MRAIETKEIFEILTQKSENKDILIIVPWEAMVFDRATNYYNLKSEKKSSTYVLRVGSQIRYTTVDIQNVLKQRLDCKQVLLEIKIHNDVVMERNSIYDWDFIEKIEFIAHITFDDEVQKDEEFYQFMLDFAFMVKDKELFTDIVKQKYGKKQEQ